MIGQISFFGKTSDRFHAIFSDSEGNNFEVDGYPPKFLGSDGINMSIDLETGQILNWKKPSQDDLEEY